MPVMLTKTILVLSCLAFYVAVALRAVDDGLQIDSSWALNEVLPEQADVAQARGRSLQSDVITVTGLPKRFTIRPAVDPTLCVHRANLTAPGGLLAAAVAAARAHSGLPPTDPSEIREYGGSRLVLMPCTNGMTDTFMAETLLGRRYYNNGTNYREGFLKPPSDTSLCVYGVNASYTTGHPVFGVSSSYGDANSSTGGNTTHPDSYDASPSYSDTDMDWFDDYSLDYAPYIRYGYDPAVLQNLTGVFRSPNPLPPTMLDASGWGPFHSGWGACMRNPTLDTAVPTIDPTTEMELRYHAWSFIDVADTASVSHLPRADRRSTYAILTLGPDRPQPDMSPDAGSVDAGEISAALGGIDRPYGNGYSALVSNELCMTASAVKAGAQVRLAPCPNPVHPTLEQVFHIAPATKKKKKKS